MTRHLRNNNYMLEPFEESPEREKILPLIDILRRMERATPRDMEFVHYICEKSSVPEDGFSWWIKMACPCHQSHSVSPLGFQLLQEVESAVGATGQVEEINFDDRFNHHGPDQRLLYVLSERASRQDVKITKMSSNYISVTSENSAKFLSSLFNKCDRLEVYTILVEDNIGPGGWANLARSFEKDSVLVRRIKANKRVMLEGSEDDLKAIWDGLADDWVIGSYFHYIVRSRGEEGWRQLQIILRNDSFHYDTQ